MLVTIVNPWAYRFLPSIIFKNIYVLLDVFTIFGLTFYIAGRKKFLTYKKDHLKPVLSAFLGSSLFAFGLYGSLVSLALIGYYHNKVADIGISYSDIFIREFPSLFWFVLWATSGIILLLDYWKILGTKAKSRGVHDMRSIVLILIIGMVITLATPISLVKAEPDIDPLVIQVDDWLAGVRL